MRVGKTGALFTDVALRGSFAPDRRGVDTPKLPR
jgi:hypothetical protein